MCGINGIVSLAGAGPIDREELLRTREAMAARGPDGAGAWVSADGRAGLASRRLAILDLSPAGAQPMASDGQAGAAAGAVQVVLNGEIYNFRELRAGLEADGYRFRGHSDTEVVLALYLKHGEALLPLLRGMFGLAIWDGHRRRLLLARDPLGVKPLYYSAGTGGDAAFRFASQVKALDASGAISPEIDPAGLAGFLLWGSVPEPWTIRRAVRALPAGHALAVEYGRPGEPRPIPVADPEPLAPEAAVEESVAAHLVSDVPVAVFLSAGLDSGLLAALARRHLPEPPTTFTLRFDVLAGTPADEAPLAAEVARTLGTRHVEHRMGREDFARLWPAALAAMDQPSIDGFNTFAVSRAAHAAGLKVVLSGLGGDELFGSYPSFRDVPRGARAARWARRLPGLQAVWPALATALSPGRPKLAGLLAHGKTLPGSYFLRRGIFLPAELPGLLGKERAEEALAHYDPIADAGKALAYPLGNGHGRLDPWVAVHCMETAQYMRNQLLRDADWASMASSVELRVPLVDAWLTRRLAGHGFAPARELGKAALVRRIAPELPAALFDRPKAGFYIPVVEWMLGRDAAPATPGGRSRTLARRVLAEIGIALAAA
jgi:asparagine synthase (glutamine-hydrolysing)